VIFEELRDERLRLVERLRPIAAEVWDLPSLCVGWRVRDVLAHLVTPFLVSRTTMAGRVIRHRGISAAMDATAKTLAQRPAGELLTVLERNANSTFRPPGLPTAAPLTDAIVHSADIRWSIGDAHADWAEPARLRPVLEFLVTPRARAGFVPKGRTRGLRFVATDQTWARGDGAEVSGPSLALAMAILGRPAALVALRGDGVHALRPSKDS
jgi:uncharacterized protein (TIGR03083 family)